MLFEFMKVSPTTWYKLNKFGGDLVIYFVKKTEISELTRLMKMFYA